MLLLKIIAALIGMLLFAILLGCVAVSFLPRTLDEQGDDFDGPEAVETPRTKAQRLSGSRDEPWHGSE